jgi:Uma2 family endonuclease
VYATPYGCREVRRILHVATTTQKSWTDDELMALPGEGKYELVDGQLVHVSPAGARHGDIVTKLLVRLHIFS